MHANGPTQLALRAENTDLRARLQEAQEALSAIRSGEVDALVIESVSGPQVFTLHGVDAESNRFRGEILAQVSDAVIAVDDERRVTYLNAAAERQYRVAASEVLGGPLGEIYETRWIHPEDEGAATTALHERVEWLGENIHITHDGRELNVESSVAALRGPAHPAGGMLSVIRDITRRKQAEAAQRHSDERYVTLFNSVNEGFCIIEMMFGADGNATDYRFLEVNPAFESQSGLHDAQGKRMRELVADHEAHWFETYGKVALTGEPARFVNEAKGLGRWFDVAAFRFGGSASRKVAVLFTDITERKRSELELHQAVAAAERANRAKSEFLSSMSHELRSPLNAILGFAQLMESGTPPPTVSQARSIQQILQGGWYLLELINQILDLALVESGKLSLSLEPIALADVLLECQVMMEPEALKRGIGMATPPFLGPRFVNADRTRLKQVLINLLSNAIKYNRPGGTVTVDCRESAPGRLRIGVSDTGAGLSTKQLAALFQPFNRLGQEATAEQGTGIGLVVSKRLVEMMGGVLGVQSTVGTGTDFWIELALTAAPQHATAIAEPACLAQEKVPADATMQTLLYVEDNPANRMLIEDLIARRSDVCLLSASDGPSGVEMARACLPDVILMDISLPGISGSKALSILADDPCTAHIPVIALSANAMPRDIAHGLEAGFFRYLTKPIRVTELMETLDLALKSASAAAAGAAMGEPT